MNLQEQIELANAITLSALKTGVEIGIRQERERVAKEQAVAQDPSCEDTQFLPSREIPAPAAASYGRPRDDQLIAAVSMAFDVNADIARHWLVEAFSSDRKTA